MKKILSLIFYLSCQSVATGQDNISMLLVDENFNPIPQQEINSILVSICGPDTVTSIFKEEYKSPLVNYGNVNLKTGSGTRLSPLNYNESIRQYYNSLPPDKRPTSESFLIVKLEVKLSSGKSIVLMNEIKFNTSVPLIKGDKKEFSYLNEKQLDLVNESEKINVSPPGVILEKLNSQTAIRSIFKAGSSEWINGNNRINLDPASEFNFIAGASGSQQKFFFNPFSFGLQNNQTSIWNLNQSGFEHQYLNLRTTLTSKGLILADTTLPEDMQMTPGRIIMSRYGQQTWNINQTGFVHQYENYKSRLEDGGLFIDDTTAYLASLVQAGHMSMSEGGIPFWNINKDGFVYNSSSNFQTSLNQGIITTTNPNNLFKTTFSPGGISIANNASFGWDFNPVGGSWKPDKDKSFTFNSTPGFGYSISDAISKRRLEASYAGFSGFFDSKNIFNLAVGTTGSPFLNMFRTNSSLAASLGLNSEAAGDFRLTGSAGTPYLVQTSVAGSNGQRPYVFITLDGLTPLAGIYIDAQGRGVVFGTLKNFNADHPLQAEKNIVYSSLEGPEAAAYCRGKAQMKGGKAFVPFPDHFVLVCAPEDMTIQATPRSISSKGLAITSVSEKGFMVEELMGGGGTYEFFWEAKGIRKGFENYEVVRNKSEVMPAEYIKPVMDKN